MADPSDTIEVQRKTLESLSKWGSDALARDYHAQFVAEHVLDVIDALLDGREPPELPPIPALREQVQGIQLVVPPAESIESDAAWEDMIRRRVEGLPDGTIQATFT